MTKKIILDTNILIYLSVDGVEYFLDNFEKVITNNQIYIVDRSLLEMYRVLTSAHKFNVDEALNIVNFYQNNSNYNIIRSTDFSNQILFKLAYDYNAKSGKIFDLDILSIAIEKEVDEIYTNNIKDFPSDQGVKIFNPVRSI